MTLSHVGEPRTEDDRKEDLNVHITQLTNRLMARSRPKPLIPTRHRSVLKEAAIARRAVTPEKSARHAVEDAIGNYLETFEPRAKYPSATAKYSYGHGDGATGRRTREGEDGRIQQERIARIRVLRTKRERADHCIPGGDDQNGAPDRVRKRNTTGRNWRDAKTHAPGKEKTGDKEDGRGGKTEQLRTGKGRTMR